MTVSTQAIPEHIQGEPALPDRSVPAQVRSLLRQLFWLVIVTTIVPIIWPFYLLHRIFLPRPPNIPAPSQYGRYLVAVWTDDPPPWGYSRFKQVCLTLDLVRRFLLAPFWGLCWYLDEVLYGKLLAQNPVVAPLFELSAARSGSTQLAHYLEDDPQIATPGALMVLFPYLWLWKLIPKTIGRRITKERFNELAHARLPEAFLQRHENDFFRTDTFEIYFYMNHLNLLSMQVSEKRLVRDFAFARYVPENEAQFEKDFIEFIDGIGRKILAHKGPQPNGQPRKFFIKGHFLMAAHALERRYPDASFLTMIREPVKRLQSCINYFRVNPGQEFWDPTPWPWLVALMDTEEEYCRIEQAWYTRPQGPRRCVIRFGEYVKDLEGTMKRVYKECLGQDEVPPHVPRVHAARERTNYVIDRSLTQLGIDEQALTTRLADYVKWCKGK